jgi:hypothetical protein
LGSSDEKMFFASSKMVSPLYIKNIQRLNTEAVVIDLHHFPGIKRFLAGSKKVSFKNKNKKVQQHISE